MPNYFDPMEFACKCGCGAKDIDPRLKQWLNVMRHYAEEPIHVLSGVRCMAHNKAVGGSPKSQHLPDERDMGCAADIYIKGWDLLKLFERAVIYGLFGGIGIYPHSGFIHVDSRITPYGGTYKGAVRWIELLAHDGKKIVLPFNCETLKKAMITAGGSNEPSIDT